MNTHELLVLPWGELREEQFTLPLFINYRLPLLVLWPKDVTIELKSIEISFNPVHFTLRRLCPVFLMFPRNWMFAKCKSDKNITKPSNNVKKFLHSKCILKLQLLWWIDQ